MEAAKVRLRELRSSRYSPLTKEAYASDWADFERWCESVSRDSLPAHPETVALYLSHRLPTHKVSTLGRRLAAIASKHQLAGLPAPITPMVKMVLHSARRGTRQRVRRKAAISIEELGLVSKWLAGREGLTAVRNRAMILLGFAGAFRRSELVGLDLADIELLDDRVTVSLGRSKTDQEGRGRVLVIPRAQNPQLCAIRALGEWIAARGSKAGPVFPQLRKNVRHGSALTLDRLAGTAVWYALKVAAAGAGLDAAKFGAHSLRAGFVTASADAGADVWDIMATTGHKNVENLGLYVRRAVSRYPLRAVL